MKDRTVYAIEHNGMRYIIAAPSLNHAAKVLGYSAHSIKQHGTIGVTRSSEVEIANSDPGAVFARAEDGEWAKVKSSKLSNSLSTPGGYRKGGGQKRIGATVAEQFTIRLSDWYFNAFRALGGTAWLREIIQALPQTDEPLARVPDIPNTPSKVRSIRLCAEDRKAFLDQGGTEWLRVMIEHCTALRRAEQDALTGNPATPEVQASPVLMGAYMDAKNHAHQASLISDYMSGAAA